MSLKLNHYHFPQLNKIKLLIIHNTVTFLTIVRPDINILYIFLVKPFLISQYTAYEFSYVDLFELSFILDIAATIESSRRTTVQVVMKFALMMVTLAVMMFSSWICYLLVPNRKCKTV